MSSGTDKNENDKQNDGQATERGFGTGLRAQLKRRREENEEPAPQPQEPEVPPVRFDLDSPIPQQVDADPLPIDDAQELRGELAEARKRERELRAAFAEQVEAYERKLSEEYDVSREQTMLDDKSSKLSHAQNQMREREQRLASERQELGKHTSELQSRENIVCRLLLEKKKNKQIEKKKIKKKNKKYKQKKKK